MRLMSSMETPRREGCGDGEHECHHGKKLGGSSHVIPALPRSAFGDGATHGPLAAWPGPLRRLSLATLQCSSGSWTASTQVLTYHIVYVTSLYPGSGLGTMSVTPVCEYCAMSQYVFSLEVQGGLQSMSWPRGNQNYNRKVLLCQERRELPPPGGGDSAPLQGHT